MKLSARNQLPGTVEQVHLGEIMARVVIKVGEHVMESVITRQSAEELALKKGDSVHVVVPHAAGVYKCAHPAGKNISSDDGQQQAAQLLGGSP